MATMLPQLLALASAAPPAPAPADTCLKQQGQPWPGVGTLFCCGGNATTGETTPCSRQNQRCCAAGSHSSDGGAGTSPCTTKRTPQYHVRDESCALNDPNVGPLPTALTPPHPCRAAASAPGSPRRL